MKSSSATALALPTSKCEYDAHQLQSILVNAGQPHAQSTLRLAHLDYKCMQSSLAMYFGTHIDTYYWHILMNIGGSQDIKVLHPSAIHSLNVCCHTIESAFPKCHAVPASRWPVW